MIRATRTAAMFLAVWFTPGIDSPAQGQGEAGVHEEPAGDPGSESPEKGVVVREEIRVVGDWPATAESRTYSRDDLVPVPLGDGADLLRGVSGVTMGRMGGHGLEPRIRGQGASDLNVLLDGAFVHGGCPNRMDPPSSFATADGYDEITVVKGVQTMRYGSGGTGGTLLFERSAPALPASDPWRADAWSAYGSWHGAPELGADAAWAGGIFRLRALGERRLFDDYRDGDGVVVRSGYESRSANVMLAIGSAAKGSVELGLETGRTDDALFAGAGMDSPEDRSETVRLEFRRGEPLGAWDDVAVDLYWSGVEHLMDNYSLRELTAPMAMRVPSTSDTFGGRASVDRLVGARLRVKLGLDYQENRREALRFAGPGPGSVTNLQSVMWPDTDLSMGGLFVEADRWLGRASRLRVAARYDRFSAVANAAELDPMGMNRSPSQLYEVYYGTPADDWSASAWSGLARFEHDLLSGLTLHAGISRSTRVADSTERFLGADSPASPGNIWVGNPALAPARHDQLDLGVGGSGGRGSWSASGFIDFADDFILRDRAHGQDGVLREDNASIYRNVDARLFGLEVEGRVSFGPKLEIDGTASWVRGDNLSDDRVLAQIPPLQGGLSARYGVNRWSAALGLRYAARQTRVDDDPTTGSGLDYGPTPGYAVLDVSGTYRILESLSVVAGLDNLLDHTYADHLNRGNLFDPEPIRINEPGRTAWIRLRWHGGAPR
jgi:iron complex outermembrane receptor protein